MTEPWYAVFFPSPPAADASPRRARLFRPRNWLALLLCLPAQAAEIGEYQIKAAFLHNFASFIAWPETLKAEQQNHFNICVLGENPFAKDLDLIVARANQDANEHREVRYIDRVQDIGQCRILYISDSEAHRQSAILDYAAAHPLLTVSSISGFARKGGMLEFYKKANKVRFFINLPILRRADLKADANLLRVADVIAEDEGDSQ